MTTRGLLGAPLHLLTGKGGVGKTTIAAALGLAAARRGARPIVVELGHRASLARALGCSQAIGHEPSEVVPGLFATNLELDHALPDYLARRIRSRSVARKIASSPALRTFFEAAPAVSELLALERIESLLERFDPVIVDLDATGHAIMFLELPRLLGAIAPRGPIGELVRGLGALLTDTRRTRLHLVTLPEPLPIEETLELHERLALVQAPTGALFLNRARERPLARENDPLLESLLARLEAEPSAVEARDALEAARRGARAFDAAARSMARLSTTGRRITMLPELDELGDLDALSRLGSLAAEAVT